MSEPAYIPPLAAAKPSVSFINVPPDLAARWLETNSGNRNLRSSQVKKWTREMLDGRWSLSNDAVCFDSDGTLINGQHRLHGVVASGETVVLLVIRNMPLDAVINMDTGTARTAGDVLGFAGESKTHLLASATKQCLLIESGRIYQDRAVQNPSHAKISDFLSRNSDVRAAVDAASRHRTIDATPTAVAAAFWLISRAAGYADADRYFTQLASLHNEPAGSAVFAVDSRLRQIRRSSVRVSTRELIYLLVKGWNHYARDGRVRTLTTSPKNSFRIPAPVRWQR